MSAMTVNIQTPYVTQERYAELAGLTVDSVRAKVAKGHIPTVKQGRSRLVNMAALLREALQEQ